MWLRCILRATLALSLFFSIHCLAQGGTKLLASPKERLDKIIFDYYEQYAQLFPRASADPRYKDQLENSISETHRQRQRELYTSTMKKLQLIRLNQLPEPSQYDCEILEYVIEHRLKQLQYPWHLLPEGSFSGITIDFLNDATGNGHISFASVSDYDAFLKRVDIFADSICDTVIHNMRLGIQRRVVQPKHMMELEVRDLQSAIIADVEKSPFYLPVLQMPDSFSLTDKQRLRESYKNAILQKLNPAYTRILNFIQTEYLPACRETVGICAYSWGKAAYQDIMDYYYGSYLNPDTLLQRARRVETGYAASLQEQMLKRGFSGTVDSFFKTFPRDSFCVFKTSEEVLSRFRKTMQRIHDSLPKYFSYVPESNVEFLESLEKKGSPGSGRFISGSEDGSRPNRIYIFIGDPVKFGYVRVPGLCIHEGDPGHHFEWSFVEHRNSLVSQNEYFEPFDEGWASYAETLQRGLGVTDDYYVYSYFLRRWSSGSQIDELENGINIDGWSYERCVDFCLNILHYPNKESADQIIFRFVCMPAQSHSYPLGYQKFVELRERARKELGAAFDLREFHTALLKDGLMPLFVLDHKMNNWIAAQKKRVHASIKR